MDGGFDGLSEADTFRVMTAIRTAAARDLDDIAKRITQNAALDDDDRARMIGFGQRARRALEEQDGANP
jgi:F-type H+-transporting ATPase subunit alpha